MDQVFRAIPNLLSEFDDNPKLEEAFIFAGWRKIAGESLRSHTVPVQYYKKRLVIAVSDKMWKRHLELLSGQMVFKLNAVLKSESVSFIEFKVDAGLVASQQAASIEKTVVENEKMASEQITQNLKNSADLIKDKELRKQFLLAAGSCLARKERMKGK